jgi:membrane protein DedA with SNARE-associated domain
VLERFIGFFTTLPGGLVAVLVFLLAGAEAGLFFGFVLPGELAVVLGGVLAARGQAVLWQVMTAAVAGAIIGDSCGYALGKRFGAAFLARRLGAKWDRVQAALVRWGPAAVLVGRFSALLRAIVPSAAGAAGIHYPTFLLWNALGGCVWGAGFTLLGWLAGDNYETVLRWAGRGGMAILALLAIVLLVAWRWRRRVRERRA